MYIYISFLNYSIICIAYVLCFCIRTKGQPAECMSTLSTDMSKSCPCLTPGPCLAVTLTQHRETPQFNMLGAGPVLLGMPCDVTAVFYHICSSSPSYPLLTRSAAGQHHNIQPEAGLMMHESCRVT